MLEQHKFVLLRKQLLYNLDNIFNIILKRKFIIKLNIFQKIKNISFDLNKKQTSNALNKIISNTKIIFQFYKKKQKFLLLKKFLIWKQSAKIGILLTRCKIKNEKNIEKIIEQKKVIIDNKFNEKENEGKELKKKIETLNEEVNNGNKKSKNFEEKENIYANKIKIIEQEKRKIEEILKEQEKENNKIIERKNNLEICAKELEDSSKFLSEQLREKDYNLNIYMREMNEMLEVFEKKTCILIIN